MRVCWVILVLVFAAAAVLSMPAAAQHDLGRFLTPIHNTAIFVEVDRKNRARADLYSTEDPANRMRYLRVQASATRVNLTDTHFAMVRRLPDSVLFAYALQPLQVSAPRLASFDLTANIQDSTPRLEDVTSNPGLTIYSRGVQRILVWNRPLAQPDIIKVDGLGNILAEAPDMVAFRLPEGRQLRVLDGMAEAVVPDAFTMKEEVIAFSGLSNPLEKIRIRYDVPEPGWVELVFDNLNRVVTPLMAIVLYFFTKSDKVNLARWRVVAGFSFLIVVAINALYIYRAMLTGAGLSQAWVDFGMVFIFAAIAIAGAFVLKKPDTPAEAVPTQPKNDVVI